ncbi:MAG: hypothetical protein HY337_05115 [Gemmatimonadetes bacterium]|nr:hypothetical protein [Gemmatimonadota bacterium]
MTAAAWRSVRAAVFIGVMVACEATDEAPEKQAMSIEQAQAQLTESVMRLPGVTGVAIGLCDDKPCIKVYVVKRTRALAAQIPPAFEGYLVDVVESGEIKPL